MEGDAETAGLEERWRAICSTHAQDAAAGAWPEISNHYEEAHRAYHTFEHIAHCLSHFDRVRRECRDPVAVEFAIWLHDIIYNPKATDNEEASAAFASGILKSPVEVETVKDLILATAHGGISPDAESDAAILCDIDLSILGAKANAYDRYAAQIREEYAFVPEDAYRAGRGGILQTFLGRPRIYVTGHFRDLEESARANLRRELDILG